MRSLKDFKNRRQAEVNTFPQFTFSVGTGKKRKSRAFDDGVLALEPVLRGLMDNDAAEVAACRLIHRFGTVSAVLGAEPDELRQAAGEDAAAVLVGIKTLFAYSLLETCAEKPIVTNSNDLDEFLLLQLGQCCDEQVLAVFLDSGNHIIGAETVARGSVNRCVILPQHIFKAAFNCHAVTYILARNQTGHDTAAASETDWKTVERLCDTGKLIDVPLIDYAIVTKKNIAHLRSYRRWPTL